MWAFFRFPRTSSGYRMIFELFILGALVIALLIVLPFWPYNRHWGYWPAVIVGIVLITLLVMTLAALVPR
jgi:hypothetical protein